MSLRLAILILAVIAIWKVMAYRKRLAARPPAPSVEATGACPDCGAYVIARNPKPCARKECRYRQSA